MERELTDAERLAVLLTWLGCSGPAFLLATWGVWEAWRDLRAAGRHRPRNGLPRLALVGQARCNLALALTFFLQGLVYLGLGLLVVAGPATVTLLGPASLVVLVPPGVLILQVLVLQINRVLQERLR